MINGILMAVALSFSMSAFAGSYVCEPMKNAEGEVLSTDIIYSVLNTQQSPGPNLPSSLILQVSVNQSAPLVSLSMELSKTQSSEGAIYVADETQVQVTYSVGPVMPGFPTYFIGVREMVGNSEFRANCPAQSSP